MNRRELEELYKDHELGHINAEIYCLEERKNELELTPEQLRKLAEIKEKLNYLYSIKETKKRT
jgi:hypothetical protein